MTNATAQPKVRKPFIGNGIDFTTNVDERGWYWVGLGDFEGHEAVGRYPNPRMAIQAAKRELTV